MQPLHQRGLSEFDSLIEQLQDSVTKNSINSEKECDRMKQKVMEIIENYQLFGSNDLDLILKRLDTVVSQKLEVSKSIFKPLFSFIGKKHEPINNFQKFIVVIQEANKELLDVDKFDLQHISKLVNRIYNDNPVLADNMFTLLPDHKEKAVIRQIWQSASNNHQINLIEKQIQRLQEIPFQKEKERFVMIDELGKSLDHLLMQIALNPDEEVILILMRIQGILEHEISTKMTPLKPQNLQNKQLTILIEMRDRVYHATKLLMLFPYLPKDFEELKNPSSAEILSPFVDSFRKLVQLDKNFAFDLTRRLAESSKNLIFIHLVRDYDHIDFDEHPIHVDVLQVLLGLHPEIYEVKYKNLVGFEGRLDLSQASLKATQDVLLREGKKVTSLTLSEAFLLSEEITYLAIQDDPNSDPFRHLVIPKIQERWEDHFLKGSLHAFKNVQELHIVPLKHQKPLELEAQQLHVFIHLFPEVKLANLPPMKIIDSDRLAYTRDHIFMEEDKQLRTLKKHFKKLSPQFRLSLMRSLCSGGLASPLYWSLFKHHFETDNFYTSDYVLQQVLVAQQSFPHQPVSLIDSGLVNDWMSLGHRLLSLGLMDQVILKYHHTFLDLSNQPLLTDEKLLSLLDTSKTGEEANIKKVGYLHLRHCPHVTFEAVQEILIKSGELKELDLSGNPQIDDETFLSLPLKSLAPIGVIRLRGTSVTERGISAIKRRYPEAYIVWDPRGQNGKELRKESGKLLLDFGGRKVFIHPEIFARQDRGFANKCANEGIPEELKFEKPLSDTAIEVMMDYLYEGHVSKLDEAAAWELYGFLQENRVLGPLNYYVGAYLRLSTTPENVLDRLESHPEGRKSWINYLAVCCYPGSSAFNKMTEEQQGQVHELLLSEKYPIIRSVGWLYERDILPEKFPDCFNEKVTIEGSGGEIVEVQMPINFLRLQSDALCKAFETKPPKIKASNPKMLALAFEAVKNEKVFDFKDGKMSLSEGVSFLEEMSRWGLVDSQAIDVFGLLRWWVEHKLIASADHPDWDRLVKWVNTHSHPIYEGYKEHLLDVIKRRRMTK